MFRSRSSCSSICVGGQRPKGSIRRCFPYFEHVFEDFLTSPIEQPVGCPETADKSSSANGDSIKQMQQGAGFAKSCFIWPRRKSSSWLNRHDFVFAATVVVRLA